MKTYKHVALGGTFDHIHDGHKALLDQAFESGQKVSIGVADDDYNHQKVMSGAMQKYDVRLKALQDYLKQKGYASRASFFPLHDIYGPTTEKNDIEALVVSKETLPNARIINRKRKAQNMPQLKIVLVQLVKGKGGQIIRSTKIRRGEMDRFGNLFITYLKKKPKYYLPTYLRPELQKPLGIVLKSEQQIALFIANRPVSMLISVGDAVTAALISINVIPNLQIIDYKTRRLKNTSVKIPDGRKPVIVINSVGAISRTASKSIHNAIGSFLKTKSTQYIVVRGEEDLTALCAILLAPLKSVVVYGQYGLGVVLVEVTEEIKESVKKLIEKFT